MTTVSTRVTTSGGIAVDVVIVRADGIVTATADAVSSELTRSYDELFLREEARYLEAVATHGLCMAGEPPLSGAEKYLAEVEVRPVESMGASEAAGVRYTGGGGTEWKVVWTFLSAPTPAQFAVTTLRTRTTIQLP